MRIVAPWAILGRNVPGLCRAAPSVVLHAAPRKLRARRGVKQARTELLFAVKAKRAPAARANAKGARVADATHDVIARGILEALLCAPGACADRVARGIARTRGARWHRSGAGGDRRLIQIHALTQGDEWGRGERGGGGQGARKRGTSLPLNGHARRGAEGREFLKRLRLHALLH
jgi:hypothetical protein